ncbi:ATP-binding SpoIIE family protein phosphatase [Flavisolibacter nicotianae]|uniref:ATP-binding SpoIIE family protein phosphatase n=1 Tax=Flavisolibacter nicotianae TaxID=2364882 RepID=UPI000EB261B0|nr:ATP-binding SpoIIE family protein phosphatase [Flavisolibacter nicotianae]
MVNAVHLRLNAADRSYFAILKKEIHALAASAGFGLKRLAEIDIVVAEIVSNLSKHAIGGEVLVKLIEEKGLQGIEIISIDNGPGINDLKNMMVDGASSKNTLGQGLGAIRRLSDVFQIYTQKGWGTLLLSRLFDGKLPEKKVRAGFDVRSLLVPKPGETECGDGFYFKHSKEHLKLFLGDGLGHGKEAAIAVNTAIEAFKVCHEHSPVENLRFINLAVKKTRGLVATVAIFHFKERRWAICGVGNISTKTYSVNGAKYHNPYNGIVGLNMPTSMKDQEILYEPGQCLIMCSDGLKSKWDMLKFPGILRNDLSLLDAVLFKEFVRGTDDASIASCKLYV